MQPSRPLPPFAGYCPPGQLGSMSRRLATAALLARQRRQWQTSELPAATALLGDRSFYLALVALAAGLLLLAGPLLARHRAALAAPAAADFPMALPRA